MTTFFNKGGGLLWVTSGTTNYAKWKWLGN